MKRENFYRRNPNDALAGMVGMTLEERGVYNTIIDLLYSTWRPVEDSRMFIANWCGCAVQKLNPILDRLIARGKLLRFEEGGVWYISNCRFEAERADVKGSETTRSGRGKRGEKSAGVGEKSAGVEENPGLLEPGIEQKQGVTPLEKSREEKKEANASYVGSGDPTATDDELDLGLAQPPPAKPRTTPTAKEVDAIWAITPKLGRERSGRKDLERALAAAMRRGHSPEAVLAGVKAAYASATYSGEHAKGVHRLIEADRWQTFVEGEAVSAGSGASWPGPPQVREAVVRKAGEDFAKAYLDTATWQEVPKRAVIAANAYCAGKLRSDVGNLFAKNDIQIISAERGAA